MFILFVCLSHRGRLIGVKLVKMPKYKLVRHFSTDRALYSDKARSFSQSERALYRSFIIMYHFIITIFFRLRVAPGGNAFQKLRAVFFVYFVFFLF